MKTIHKKYCITAFIVWSGSAVILVAAYLLLMSSRVMEYRMIQQTAVAKEKEYQDALIAARPGSEKKITERLAHQQEVLGNFVADHQQAANLTFVISQLAQARNIISPSVKDKNKGVRFTLEDCDHIWKKEVDVEFRSGFLEFFGMLHAIESHRPVMFVETFSIIPDGQGENVSDVSFDISILAGQTRGG